MEHAGYVGTDSVKFNFTTTAVKNSHGFDLSLTSWAPSFLILYKKIAYPTHIYQLFFISLDQSFRC